MLTVMDDTTPAVFGSWLIKINKEKWIKTSGYLIVGKKVILHFKTVSKNAKGFVAC